MAVHIFTVRTDFCQYASPETKFFCQLVLQHTTILLYVLPGFTLRSDFCRYTGPCDEVFLSTGAAAYL